MNLTTEKLINITYSEMDYNLVLKPSSLFNYLQDLASENAENLGFGYSATYPKNLGWFLLKYRMEFENYPKSIKSLRLTTEPRGFHKLFAYRNFKIYNGENLLGKISSTWSLVNFESKKLSPIDKSINSPNLIPYTKKDDDLNYEKIPELTRIDIEKFFEIRFDDIDVNKHVNNANYIIWAFEPLGFDLRSSKTLKTLDVVFKKEIKYGEKVRACVQIENNTTIHILKNANNDDELCAIKAEWT